MPDKDFVLSIEPTAFLHYSFPCYQVRLPNPNGIVLWSPISGVEYTEAAAWRSAARSLREKANG